MRSQKYPEKDFMLVSGALELHLELRLSKYAGKGWSNLTIHGSVFYRYK